jgi:hypothetical protein
VPNTTNPSSNRIGLGKSKSNFSFKMVNVKNLVLYIHVGLIIFFFVQGIVQVFLPHKGNLLIGSTFPLVDIALGILMKHFHWLCICT